MRDALTSGALLTVDPPGDVVVTNLVELLARSALRTPEALAVRGPDIGDAGLTYRELDAQGDCMARRLAGLGVGHGDRVGVWLDKSATAVAAMQGTLRLGAAYVPLDPLAPPTRIVEIMQDCAMGAIVTTRERSEKILNLVPSPTACLHVDEVETGPLPDDSEPSVDDPASEILGDEDDLAYILYTSGSTGKPKGVCISHRNALAFIEWAAEELQVTKSDCLSNHAPFHFDLSVLDLYVAFATGASVSLIPDVMSYAPSRLVDFIIENEITIWYSVPSALILMMEQGGLLDVPKLPVRAFLFAGEPFPIKHVRRLFNRWSSARFLNLYGPTETNVCTFYEVTDIAANRADPVPIGQACSGDRVWAVTRDGKTAQPGEEGELMVIGPTVLQGYWGYPPHGDRPYATGDIVRLQDDGNYLYVGRRDHMVKRRGHRIELGDIEAALGQHPSLHEVAVVLTGSGIDARLVAFGVSVDDKRPSLLDIKRHCAERLPRYMIVDGVRFVSALPRTRNGKVNRLKLAADAATNPRQEHEARA